MGGIQAISMREILAWCSLEGFRSRSEIRNIKFAMRIMDSTYFDHLNDKRKFEEENG